MENVLAVVLSLLASIFFASLMILVVLCSYKNLRKKTAVYVKRLARSDLSHSNIELIDKDDGLKTWESRTDDLNWLPNKCSALLHLCDALNDKHLGVADVAKLRHIVQIANCISEATIKGDSDKCQVLERGTTELLASVSQALSKIDQQLVVLTDYCYADA